MKKIKIYEVGPRDGLQAIKKAIPLDTKKKLIEDLQNAFKGMEPFKEGIWPYIEVGSFVKYEKVPQMETTLELLKGIDKIKFFSYGVLVPHIKYFRTDCGSYVPAVFVASHEDYSKDNMGAPIDVTIDWAKTVIKKAKEFGLPTRAYISNIFGYKEKLDVKFDKIFEIADTFAEAGVDEFSFGDTDGFGTVEEVKVFAQEILARYKKVAFHFHVRDQLDALGLVDVAIEKGIERFDTSIGGLGGPITKATPLGNVATELLVEHLNKNGIETGVNIDELKRISRWIKEEVE